MDAPMQSPLLRYLLFQGDVYYPGDGWEDFAGSFDTLPEAVAAADAFVADKSSGERWAQVVDTKTAKVVHHPPYVLEAGEVSGASDGRADVRRGISLLEVLFAMFILSIGLLSLATLIPVAKFKINQAEQSARGGELGTAALNDVVNRGFLQPATWADSTGTAVSLPMPGFFAIDPISISENAGASGLFPFDAAGPQTPRLTLGPGMTTTVRDQIARRVFTLEHDFVLAEADEDERPPLHLPGTDGRWGVAGTDDDGNSTTDDASEAGWPGSDDTWSTFAGNYSWLFTVAPNRRHVIHEPPPLGAPSPPVLFTDIDSCKVSVAVFYKRNSLMPVAGDVEPPTERTVFADIVGGGYAGGDVTLHSDGVGEDYLKVRPGHWLLLSAVVAAPTFAHDTPMMQWYRVVTAGDAYDQNADGTIDARDVTLAGPDLTMVDAAGVPFYVDADSDPATGATIFATIFTNLIGVYEKVLPFQ